MQASPGLKGLGGNPLMLTLVALVGRHALTSRSDLPANRVELYDQAITQLLSRGFRFTAQGAEATAMRDPRLARKVLGPLSLELHRTGVQTWDDEALDEALWGVRGRKGEAAEDHLAPVDHRHLDPEAVEDGREPGPDVPRPDDEDAPRQLLEVEDLVRADDVLGPLAQRLRRPAPGRDEDVARPMAHAADLDGVRIDDSAAAADPRQLSM